MTLPEHQGSARAKQPGEQIAAARGLNACTKGRAILNLAIKPIGKEPASAKLGKHFAGHRGSEVGDSVLLKSGPFGVRSRLAQPGIGGDQPGDRRTEQLDFFAAHNIRSAIGIAGQARQNRGSFWLDPADGGGNRAEIGGQGDITGIHPAAIGTDHASANHRNIAPVRAHCGGFGGKISFRHRQNAAIIFRGANQRAVCRNREDAAVGRTPVDSKIGSVHRRLRIVRALICHIYLTFTFGGIELCAWCAYPFRCSMNKKVSAITIATLPSEMRTSLGRNLTYGMLDVIGRAIVIGDYDNVAFPTEAELARKHGVSRAVTREAVKMLTAKGLLSARPRQGTIVQPQTSWNLFDSDVLHWLLERKFSVELLRHFNQLRVAIEPEAAALAALEATLDEQAAIGAGLARMVAAEAGADDTLAADIAFHVAVLEASRNPFYKQFRGMVASALATSIRFTNRIKGRSASIEDHRAVYDAIVKHDSEGARNAMRGLIGDVLSLIGAAGGDVTG